MADTLEEIVNSTLTESNFNSSGEYTMLTTNSSTRYVLKDVQIAQGDSNVSISPTININGMDILAVGNNGASGSEIVGTSSTVKLTTDDFPLEYTDLAFSGLSSSTAYNAKLFPQVNGVIDTSQGTLSQSNVTINPQFQGSSNDFYLFAKDLGPNGNQLHIWHDMNSTTEIRVYNSAGTQLYNNGTSYTPKTFDGKQYAYWFSGTTVYKLDTWTGSATTYTNTLGSYTRSSYPRCHYIGNDWIFAYGSYSTNNPGTRPFLHNVKTLEFIDVSGGNSANTALNNISTEPVFGFHNSVDNAVYIQRWDGTNGGQYWSCNAAAGSSLTASSTSFSVSNNKNNTAANMTAYDNKLYYADNNNGVYYWDQSSANSKSAGLTVTASWGSKSLTVYQPYVSSSTVSSRTYGINPTLKIRVTGIKST